MLHYTLAAINITHSTTDAVSKTKARTQNLTKQNMKYVHFKNNAHYAYLYNKVRTIFFFFKSEKRQGGGWGQGVM